MRAVIASALLSSSASAVALNLPGFDSVNGFSNAVPVSSVGGKADCIEGYIPVQASTQNEIINYGGNQNQYNITLFVDEYTQIDSTLAQRLNGGMRQVSGTYNIFGQLCYPKGQTKSNSTLQFLTHGINFDRSYWNLLPNYSYVDYAAQNGYPTFLYDRLGVGKSQHPDPIQDVQSYLETAIAHSLVQGLRAGSIGSQKWAKIAGVGHSFGSIISVGVANQYPKDFDAIILQGFSLDQAGIPATFAAFNPTIASQDEPARFPGLPSGYLDVATAQGDQLAFARYPQFDPAVFQYAHATRQTYTIGEIVTLAAVVKPAAQFTGPLDVVDGENDFIFCQSNCNDPVNQAAAVQPALFPAAAAGSQSYLVPGTGHAINIHTTNGMAFAQQIKFLQANGL